MIRGKSREWTPANYWTIEQCRMTLYSPDRGRAARVLS